MKRSAPIRRSRINPISARLRKRIGKPGKLGIVRLYGAAMTTLRREVFERDEYRCQWEGCGVFVAWDGFNAGHLAHIISRGAGGSDTAENTRCLCAYHHLVIEHANGGSGKVVPSKYQEAA